MLLAPLKKQVSSRIASFKKISQPPQNNPGPPSVTKLIEICRKT